jgi:hypothetical protein
MNNDSEGSFLAKVLVAAIIVTAAAWVFYQMILMGQGKP